MIAGVDHIGIYVRDLERSAKDFETLLGRAANWRGSFGDHAHAWFQLSNVALDVIAPIGDTESAQKTRAYIDKHGEGIWGIGFSTSDLEQTVATLSRRGLEVLPIAETRSRAANGDERSWRLAMTRRAGTAGLALFFVEQAKSRSPLSPATDEENSAVAALDHVVINTSNPDRAMALYGARLGLDLRLDRSNEKWGSRLLFFRCGDLVVEIGAKLDAAPSDEPDRFGGLAWRVKDGRAVHARLVAAGSDVSELRQGRKAGTHVFTVRSRTSNIPTLVLEPSPRA
jgi:catechol 2,3-dioxygenase-like lactoylglutathione lyase family enzyme